MRLSSLAHLQRDETEREMMAPTGGRSTRHGSLLVTRAFAQPPHVDTAAELLAAAPLHAIIYAFTSSSYLLVGSGHGSQGAS